MAVDQIKRACQNYSGGGAQAPDPSPCYGTDIDLITATEVTLRTIDATLIRKEMRQAKNDSIVHKIHLKWTKISFNKVAKQQIFVKKT